MSSYEITRAEDLPDVVARLESVEDPAELIRRAGEIYSRALMAAVVAGYALRSAKAQVPHGEWTEWVDRHWTHSRRHAQYCMSVAREFDALEDDDARSSYLSGSLRSAVGVKAKTQRVAFLPESEVKNATRCVFDEGEIAGKNATRCVFEDGAESDADPVDVDYEVRGEASGKLRSSPLDAESALLAIYGSVWPLPPPSPALDRPGSVSHEQHVMALVRLAYHVTDSTLAGGAVRAPSRRADLAAVRDALAAACSEAEQAVIRRHS